MLLLFLVTRSLNPTDPLIDPPHLPQLFAHGLYLQDVLGYGNASVGFWSLCIEVQFYLSFIVLLGIRRWLQRRVRFGSWPAGPICLLATSA